MGKKYRNIDISWVIYIDIFEKYRYDKYRYFFSICPSLLQSTSGKKALPYKWVFKTKTDQNENALFYKARLLIKGYAQRRGIDYKEINLLVVRYTTIRYLFALASRWEMDQIATVSAFLQGVIDKDIYMQQPEQYEQGSQVCMLHKSIYGLKQASRL